MTEDKTELMMMRAREAREFTLGLTGFDLFASPQFLEMLVCRIIGARQTGATVPHDALTKSGIKIEIKSAQWDDHKGYAFYSLKTKSKGADAYVLVGHRGDGTLDFFLSPVQYIWGKGTIALRPKDTYLDNRADRMEAREVEASRLASLIEWYCGEKPDGQDHQE